MEFCLADGVMTVMIDGRPAAMHAGRTYALALGPVAIEIWEALDLGTSYEDLLRGLVDRYAGDPAQMDGDLRRFLAKLEAEGLIIRRL